MSKTYAYIIFGILIFSLMQIAASELSDDFTLKVTPEQPNPGDSVTLKILNKTGNPIGRVKFTVYDSRMEVVYDSYVSGGVLTLGSSDTKETGVYKVKIEDYSDSFNFSVKKVLWYAGPNPSNPVVSEKITMGVPAGVGVKVYEANGSLYLACKTMLDSIGRGLVSFNVDKAGNYDVKLAEVSSVYWEKSIPLTVNDREKFSVAITPEKPVPEEVVTIKLTSRGSAVDNANVVITTPSGKIETKTSSIEGKVTYLPIEIGEYSTHIEKDKYEPVDEKFSVYNSFMITMNPEEVGVNDFVDVLIEDQNKDVVNDAVFYITAKNIEQITEADGKVKFSISDAGIYEFGIEKFGFWTMKQNLQVLLLSKISIEPDATEIGNAVKVETFALSTNEKISSTKKIALPSGASESITGEEYVPKEDGTYTITAKNQNYKSASGTLKVVPRPLDMSNRIDGRTITFSVNSHSVPVAGIVIIIETPTDTKTIVTNENGTADLEVQEGDFKVYGNFQRRNSMYAESAMPGSVRKEYSFATLLLLILVILLCATIAITKPWKADETGGRLFSPKRKGDTALGKTIGAAKHWETSEPEVRALSPRKRDESSSDKREETSIGKV